MFEFTSMENIALSCNTSHFLIRIAVKTTMLSWEKNVCTFSLYLYWFLKFWWSSSPIWALQTCMDLGINVLLKSIRLWELRQLKESLQLDHESTVQQKFCIFSLDLCQSGIKNRKICNSLWSAFPNKTNIPSRQIEETSPYSAEKQHKSKKQGSNENVSLVHLR